MLQHALGICLVQPGALHHGMAQHQAAVAGQIDIDHLDIRIDVADIILPRQFAADAAKAALVVDGVDQDAGA